MIDSQTSTLTIDDVIAVIKVALDTYVRDDRPDFTDTIADDMSFDYIGLDSLARVNLLSSLEQTLGMKLDPTAAYDFITPRALAEFIYAQMQTENIANKTMDVVC